MLTDVHGQPALAKRESRTISPDLLWKTKHVSSVVVKSGEPILMPEIADDFLTENSTDDAHLELLRRLEPRSGICVPLRARGRILGTLVFVSRKAPLRFVWRALFWRSRRGVPATVSPSSSCAFLKNCPMLQISLADRLLNSARTIRPEMLRAAAVSCIAHTACGRCQSRRRPAAIGLIP